MQIKDLLQEAKTRNKLLECEAFMAHLFDKDKSFLIANPDLELNASQKDEVSTFWKRILSGEPLSYILNRKEFFGLDFYVDSRVLTPRPETEMLVEYVLGEVSDNEVKILDIGTGSGAIGLSLLKNLPNASGILTDVSDDALDVARLNSKALKLESRCAFMQSDLLEGIDGDRFDVITANLPYIGIEKNHFVSKDVENHEPSVALFGGYDGLDLYRKLFEQLNKKSVQFGSLLGEFGFAQTPVLTDLLNKSFDQSEFIVEIHNDLAGIPRMFVVKSKNF